MYLEPGILQLVQTMLIGELELIKKKYIQVQQKQYKITFTWTIFIKSVETPEEAIETFYQVQKWNWTDEVYRQQRYSYQKNTERLEFNQQRQASRSGAQ